MAAEAICEIQTWDTRRCPDDGMMIRSHLVQTCPGAPRIHRSINHAGDSISRSRQNLLHKGRIKVGFESRRLVGIVPGEKNSFSLATEVKTSRHINDHGK